MTDLDFPVAVAHGGNLGEAIRRYGIAREQWIDLSTGINPHGYPVPPIGPDAWLRLPDDDDDLEAVAAAHYGAARALAVAGTQAAIRALPQLLPPGCVGVGLLTYGEYAPAFERAGFRVDRFVTPALADCRDSAAFVLAPNEPLPAHLKHLVLVNPNNPGTESFAPEIVADWHRQLASRGGTLVLDEAFADAMPAMSMASFADAEGLIVLRSVGKFFGLAGARAGFVLGAERVHRTMRALRGPWSVSGPARVAVGAALKDDAWQRAMRERLADASARLARLLRNHDMNPVHTALFAWVRDREAMRLQDGLARDGIWVRRFETVAGLRFGLPPDEAAWTRLDAALGAARGR